MPRLGTTSAWSKRRCYQRSMEFTVNDRKNQQHQHRNDRNGYNPICSHPTPQPLAKHVPTNLSEGGKGSDTYAPSPSTSSHSGPRTPRSATTSPSCVGSSLFAPVGPPAFPSRYPPSHAQSSDCPLTAENSDPSARCRRGVAAAARAGHRSWGCRCSGSRTGRCGRRREISVCACRRRRRIRGCGSAGSFCCVLRREYFVSRCAFGQAGRWGGMQRLAGKS